MSELEQSLERFLDEKMDHDRKDMFTVENIEQADWAMRKIRRASERIMEIDDLVEKKIEQLKEWAEKEKKAHQSTIEFMEGLLAPWVMEQLQSQKKKSVNLPNGVAGFRARPVKYEYDTEKLLDWVRNHDDRFFETKEVLSWGDLKKALTITADGTVLIADTGEVVDCVKATVVGESFYTKPDLETKKLSLSGIGQAQD